MDGTIENLKRSIFLTEYFNDIAILVMTTATGEYFQIGTILDEKKFLR